MSKYVPKVGDSGFCWYNPYKNQWEKRGEVIAVTPKQIVYLSSRNYVEVLSVKNEFKPIPTKADVEREQLIQIMQDISRGRGNFDTAASEIQKAGFTIPKKVKRSDVSNTIAIYFPLGFGAGNNLTTYICELLGDLVESDV